MLTITTLQKTVMVVSVGLLNVLIIPLSPPTPLSRSPSISGITELGTQAQSKQLEGSKEKRLLQHLLSLS